MNFEIKDLRSLVYKIQIKGSLLSKIVFAEKHEDCSLQGLKSPHAMVSVLPEILALPVPKRIHVYPTVNLDFSG